MPFPSGWPHIVCSKIHPQPSLFGLVDVDSWPKLTCLYMLADTFPHVAFSTTVRDLGLTLDQELNLSEHVNLITRSCYYQLRQLRVVMRSLSHDAAVVLVHAFVTSRI